MYLRAITISVCVVVACKICVNIVVHIRRLYVQLEQIEQILFINLIQLSSIEI